MMTKGAAGNGGFGTFWMLFGHYGATLTVEQLRDTYFPSSSMKTMANRHSAGLLPQRTCDVYDTRDVADWWDRQRRREINH